MKSWNEMSDEERVAWHRRHASTSTPEEAGAFVEGLLQNPEALSEFRRLLAEHDAAQNAPKPGTETPKPAATHEPPNPPAKSKKKRKS